MGKRITHSLLHLARGTLKFKMQRETRRTRIPLQLHHRQRVKVRAEGKGSRVKHLPLAQLLIKHNRLIRAAVQRRVSDRTGIRLQKDICKFHSRHPPTTSSLFKASTSQCNKNNCTIPSKPPVHSQSQRFRGQNRAKHLPKRSAPISLRGTHALFLKRS